MQIAAALAEAMFWENPGYEEDGWKKVTDQYVGSRRWQALHRIVLLNLGEGKLYGLDYRKGLTEYQDDTYPWHDEELDKLLDLYPVVAAHTVTYVRVGKAL